MHHKRWLTYYKASEQEDKKIGALAKGQMISRRP